MKSPIKNGVGRVIDFEGIGDKTAVLQIDGKEYRTSTRYLSPNDSLDPYDEEDWDEKDTSREKIDDVIGDYKDDNLITIHYREIINAVQHHFYKRLRERDIDFDGNIYFNISNNNGRINPQSLIGFRHFIEDSEYVYSVEYQWHGITTIILDDSFKYEH